MSNLTAQDLINFFNKAKAGSLFDNISSPEMINRSVEIGEYLSESAERAKDVILAKIPEENMAKIRTLVVLVLQALMLSGGQMPPFLRMGADDAEFIDTMYLAIIGILIKEEVL